MKDFLRISLEHNLMYFTMAKYRQDLFQTDENTVIYKK